MDWREGLNRGKDLLEETETWWKDSLDQWSVQEREEVKEELNPEQ